MFNRFSFQTPNMYFPINAPIKLYSIFGDVVACSIVKVSHVGHHSVFSFCEKFRLTFSSLSINRLDMFSANISAGS